MCASTDLRSSVPNRNTTRLELAGDFPFQGHIGYLSMCAAMCPSCGEATSHDVCGIQRRENKRVVVRSREEDLGDFHARAFFTRHRPWPGIHHGHAAHRHRNGNDGRWTSPIHAFPIGTAYDCEIERGARYHVHHRRCEASTPHYDIAHFR